MLKEHFLVRHELALNVNPFTDFDVEGATEDFLFVNENSDDEDNFIDTWFIDTWSIGFRFIKVSCFHFEKKAKFQNLFNV